MTLACIMCGKELYHVMPNSAIEIENQPAGGTTFISFGQYGSTVFDPMDGTYLEINICDICLYKNKEKVLLGREIKETTYRYQQW